MTEVKRNVAKRLVLFRNGDPNAEPIDFVYSRYKTRTFDKLLEDIERRVKPRDNNYGMGGVGTERLYTPNGRDEIRTLEELETYPGSIIVVTGKEKFKKVEGGYENIGGESKTNKPWNDLLGDQKSYLELNKKKGFNSTDETKIWERQRKKEIRRFTVKRNNDREFKPKVYVWKTSQIKTMDTLTKEMERLAPPIEGGAVRALYHERDGKQIESVDEIEDGQVVVVCGASPYNPESVSKPEDEDRYTPSEYGRSDDGYNDRRGRRHSYDSRSYGQSSPRSSGGKPEWVDPNPEESLDWEDLRAKDQKMLESHYSKRDMHATTGWTRIDERADQVYPGDVKLYIFKNGEGQQHKIIVLTKAQQRRGMNWVIERCATAYRINGKRVCTMDGRTVKSVDEMIHLGAYVVVPLGEKFRDEWYYLPEIALDTGADGVNNPPVKRGNLQPLESSADRGSFRSPSSLARAESVRSAGDYNQYMQRADRARSYGRKGNGRRPSSAGRPVSAGASPYGTGVYTPVNRGTYVPHKRDSYYRNATPQGSRHLQSRHTRHKAREQHRARSASPEDRERARRTASLNRTANGRPRSSRGQPRVQYTGKEVARTYGQSGARNLDDKPKSGRISRRRESLHPIEKPKPVVRRNSEDCEHKRPLENHHSEYSVRGQNPKQSKKYGRDVWK